MNALPISLPGGVWGVLAENLMASMLGLEVASGKDALSSHSQIRKSAQAYQARRLTREDATSTS